MSTPRVDGRCLSGHAQRCPFCGHAYAEIYVVCDLPLIEETRCAQCQAVLADRSTARIGDPEPWKCLDCEAAGAGYVKRARHWYKTGQGHRIVWVKDRRAEDAPRESVDPDPAPQCIAQDWQGRR